MTSPAMQLRLGVLMTIADVWEKDFSGDSGLRNELTAPDALSSVARLKKHVKDNSYPFESVEVLDVCFINGDANTRWDFYAKKWAKSRSESITICLPSPAVAWTGRQRVKKLSEYYSKFNHFFTSIPDGASNAGVKIIPLSSLHFENFNFLSSMPKLNSNNFDLGVSDDVFLSLGAVIMKIVSRAWVDADFKRIITFNSASIGDYDKTLEAILLDDFNFTNPWDMNIRFVFANEPGSNSLPLSTPSLEPFWDAADKPAVEQVRTLVSLVLPACPKKEDELTLALAAYNCIGPRYPFTCS